MNNFHIHVCDFIIKIKFKLKGVHEFYNDHINYGTCAMLKVVAKSIARIKIRNNSWISLREREKNE